jgi:LAO/AO transport system kinase
MIEGLLAGDRRSLARAISEIEDDGSEAQEMLARLYPHGGRAHIVGVTGAPGTGKSTLVNALARCYRAAGMTVGVIAVDPTSPFTGGALLGDRVRMRDLVGDPGVFVRSMATRGSVGGLAKATSNVILALDAAGFDRILVETVGVGQAEVDIAATAHSTIVVEAPGMGDEMQAMKAGVLEIADILVVNKSDREGAAQAVMSLRMMQGLAQSPRGRHGDLASETPGMPATPGWGADGGWLPPIVETVAVTGKGVEELCQWIEVHRDYGRSTGRLEARDRAQAAHVLDRALCELSLERLHATLSDEPIQQAIWRILERRSDPYAAASQLLQLAWPVQP